MRLTKVRRVAMKRGFKVLAAALAVGMFCAAPATAAVAPGFSGWSIDGGAPRYYENGILKTDSWVKYGNTFYYVGSDGYVVNNRVISADILSNVPSLNYTDTNVNPVVKQGQGAIATYPQTAAALQAQAAAQLSAGAAASQKAAQAQAAAAQAANMAALIQAQSAAAQAAQAAAQAAQVAAAAVNTGATADQVRSGAKQPCDITNDYEAFKYLHPELVTAYGADVQGLYGKYLSTYGGMGYGSTYLATIDRLYAINGNTPHYNQSYEDLHNGTHKAYTGSGEWIIEGCDDYKHNSDGYRKCSKCGHVFKHLKLSDYNNND